MTYIIHWVVNYIFLNSDWSCGQVYDVIEVLNNIANINCLATVMMTCILAIDLRGQYFIIMTYKAINIVYTN